MNGVSQKSNLRVDLHIGNFAIESENTSQVKPHPKKDECQAGIQGHKAKRRQMDCLRLPQTASDCVLSPSSRPKLEQYYSMLGTTSV